MDPRDARTPEQVLADAEAFGVDLTTLDSQLLRTPEELLQALSDDMEFFREVDRLREDDAASAGAQREAP